MTKREATATIKGYHYQFDKTILEILSAADDEQVVVEGLEDVDLESPSLLRSIQCKYQRGAEARQRYASRSAMPYDLSLCLTSRPREGHQVHTLLPLWSIFRKADESPPYSCRSSKNTKKETAEKRLPDHKPSARVRVERRTIE